MPDLSKLFPHLNSDQAFSLLTSLIAMAGTALAANGAVSADLQSMILGVVTTAGTFAISWVFNLDGTPLDRILSVSRKGFLVIGTYAAARGWVTADQVQSWTGPVIAVVTLIASQWNYAAVGPTIPGTTIVAAPK